MSDTVQEKFERMRKVINLQRPDRMPTQNDWGYVEYRKEEYHLGEPELPVPEGEVVVSTDGKKRYTADGGIWGVGDEQKYKDYTDVLDVDVDIFEVEEVGPEMIGEMNRILKVKSQTHFPVPQHYGTLITRTTIEFGWEPFLMASALEPRRFGAILDRFGQASLAVAEGWAEATETGGLELISIHDDIASTRGSIMNPEWMREYVFPWYQRIFAAIHERGRKVLYVSDGNYMPLLDDILAANPDGFYIESTSMDPCEFMRRVGKDKLFQIGINCRNVDFGTPDDIYKELKMLSSLHKEFPGMMIHKSNSNPKPGNLEVFNNCFRELLVYEA